VGEVVAGEPGVELSRAGTAVDLAGTSTRSGVAEVVGGAGLQRVALGVAQQRLGDLQRVDRVGRAVDLGLEGLQAHGVVVGTGHGVSASCVGRWPVPELHRAPDAVRLSEMADRPRRAGTTETTRAKTTMRWFGGEARMARREDQAVVADPAQDAEVRRVHDAVPFHAVADRRIRHLDPHRVSLVQRVDVAERRTVGRAVPGDGRGAVLSGERRAVEGAGALAQRSGA
jgi:hypothetical protein